MVPRPVSAATPRVSPFAALAGVLALCAAAAPRASAQSEPLTLEALFSSRDFDLREPAERHFTPDGEALISLHEGAWWREELRGGARVKLADWTRLEGELRAARPMHVAPHTPDPNLGGDAHERLALDAARARVAGSAFGDLYVLDLASGMARFVTDDPAPEWFAAWSPDGRRLAFVREGDLYWVEPDSGRTQRLTDRRGAHTLLHGQPDWAYEEELLTERAFWWSPDGREIAFLQLDLSPVSVYPIIDELERLPRVREQRYPQAGGRNARVRLGRVPAEGGEPRFVDLGPETDVYIPRAGFTPAGALWYQWLSRDQRRLELRLVDERGASRTLLVEQDPAWVNLGDGPLFVDAQRFLWTSERDGWRHIYLYDTGGRLLRRLTSGAWQVEKLAAVDPAAGGRVFFEATQAGPRERHVYAVRLDGSGFTRLTREPGTHAAEVAPGARLFLDRYSNLSTPPRLEVRAADGTPVRRLHEGALPGLARVGPTAIEFTQVTADDGTRLDAALVKPRGFDPARRYPALVYIYGGPHSQLVKDEWGAKLHLFLRYLADQGLVVFWLDNRGGAGRGHAFEAAVQGRLGEQELADHLAGVRHLRGLPYIDGSRLGIYGGSYGGFMVLSALLRAPEVFRAGAAYAPVTDWLLYDSIYTERYMGLVAANPEGYARTALPPLAASLRAPLLLFHGTMDDNVHLHNTLTLTDALRAAGKPFELMLYPRVRHAIRRSRVAPDFHRRVAQFLLRELGVQGERQVHRGGP